MILKSDSVIVFQLNGETVRIESWGRDSLRVRATRNAAIRDDLPGALLAPEPTPAVVSIQEGDASITNGRIRAVITSKGRIEFKDATTVRELVSERITTHWPPARLYASRFGDCHDSEVCFGACDDERLYGLGQHQHGFLDQKGLVIDLAQTNTEIAIPFLLSNRGYGFLWNNPSIGRVELGRSYTRWVAESTKQIDYWVTAGATPADIMRNYADATGHTPVLPEFAAGFWQCKLRYRTQEELLEVAREYRRRKLPLSVIVVDFFHWTLQGDWRFNPKYWPDPAGMVRELESLGIKVMVSIWPSVNVNSENFKEMQERGLLIGAERGTSGPIVMTDVNCPGQHYVHYYDATNPEARRFIWEKAKRNYYDHGVRVWWLDACEPEMYPRDFDNLRFHLGNGREVGSIYPLLHAKAFYDGMREAGETEIISLCRSAWAGSQRFGAAVWSGDITSTFESLRSQVKAGLNMALSGIPWWTTDIGGFTGGDPSRSSFRELLIRWFQYGVFCPLFRLHGVRDPWANDIPEGAFTGAENEAWSFGDEAYAIIRELLFMRERLRPYIMSLMRAAHEQGVPPMRPLFFDFPGDAASWTVEDEFMFGPDLLVAPVIAEGQRNRTVYLPSGCSWTDAWSGAEIKGGQSIDAAAPLERIPVFLRDGAQVPVNK